MKPSEIKSKEMKVHSASWSMTTRGTVDPASSRVDVPSPFVACNLD